jgi:hypothetical protein
MSIHVVGGRWRRPITAPRIASKRGSAPSAQVAVSASSSPTIVMR